MAHTVCECEHESHFVEADRKATEHGYGESEYDKLVKTDYGTFALCLRCVSLGHLSPAACGIEGQPCPR